MHCGHSTQLVFIENWKLIPAHIILSLQRLSCWEVWASQYIIGSYGAEIKWKLYLTIDKLVQ